MGSSYLTVMSHHHPIPPPLSSLSYYSFALLSSIHIANIQLSIALFYQFLSFTSDLEIVQIIAATSLH